MCEHPWIRIPVGVKKDRAVLSEDLREAMTPHPCGQCLMCRINRSRVWQHRMMLESMCHAVSSFVTLTYSPEACPSDMSLRPDDLTGFIKRLRSALGERKVRYFGVGEYGEEESRPHYHLALFGVGLPDKVLIERCWSQGFVLVGSLTKDSARYMTGYVIKSLKDLGPGDGRLAPFMRCSTKPGLGADAVDLIARKLEGYPDVGLVRQLRHGPTMWPLGRYLTHRLAERMGIDSEERLREYREYQSDLLDAHLEDGQILLDNVLKAYEGKRSRKSALHKIWNQRRRLS